MAARAAASSAAMRHWACRYNDPQRRWSREAAQAVVLRRRPVTSRANSSGRVRGHQCPASTSTRVRSRQRASRPATERGATQTSRVGTTSCTGSEVRQGTGVAQARDRRWRGRGRRRAGRSAESRPQGRGGGRVERASSGRSSRWSVRQTSSGSHGELEQPARTSCAAPAAAAAAGRRQDAATLPRWSSEGPLMEVYDAMRPSSRGSHVSAATRPSRRRSPSRARRGAPARPAGRWRPARRPGPRPAGRSGSRPAGGARRPPGTADVVGDDVPHGGQPSTTGSHIRWSSGKPCTSSTCRGAAVAVLGDARG